MAPRTRKRDNDQLAESVTGNSDTEAGTAGIENRNGVDVGEVIIVDPTSARDGGSSDSDRSDSPEQPKRRRGRQPGSRNKEKTAQIDITRLEGLLIAIHLGLAQATQSPEFFLEAEEATSLAKATADVARYYPTAVALLDGKIMDHLAFFGALARVYGTRVIAISARLKREAQQKKQQQPNVTQFPGA